MTGPKVGPICERIDFDTDFASWEVKDLQADGFALTQNRDVV